MLSAEEYESIPTLEEDEGHQVSKDKKMDVKEQFKPLGPDDTSLLIEIIDKFGHFSTESDKYILSLEFESALDDLLKVVLPDDGPIMIKLSELQLFQKHLIPLTCAINVKTHEIAMLSLLDMILLFTSSTLTTTRAPAPSIIDARKQYKKVFEHVNVNENFLKLMVFCLHRSNDSEITRAHKKEMLDKILKLYRNILLIPDGDSMGGSRSNNIALSSTFGRHQRVIEAMNKGRICEFFHVIGASLNDSRDSKLFQDHVNILFEIFSLIFTPASPDGLVSCAQEYENPEGPRKFHTEEALQREKKTRKPIRHSKFSGSLCVKLSTGEDYMLAASRLLNPGNDSSMDVGKRQQSYRKKLSINEFGENGSFARSSQMYEVYKIALAFIKSQALTEMIKCLLNKVNIADFERDSQNIHFLDLLSWTLRFCRQIMLLKKEETSEFDFDWCLQLCTPHIMLAFSLSIKRMISQKQFPLLLSSMRYFRESLRILDLMGTSIESAKDQISDIERELFYHRDFILVQLQVFFCAQKFTLKMLSMIIEVNYVVVKMLTRFCENQKRVYMIMSKQKSGNALSDDDRDQIQNDEDNVDARGKEKEFMIQDHIADFANEKGIQTFTRLLREFERLDPSTNRFVAFLISKIITVASMPHIFYRISTMEAFHKIITCQALDLRRQNKDLIKIGNYLTSRFVEKVASDPTFIVCAFFDQINIEKNSKRLGSSSKQPSLYQEDHVHEIEIPSHFTKEEGFRWIIQEILDAELSTSLNWLIGQVFDSAACRGENGASEDFYLLAQSETIKNSFSNPYFFKLLKLCDFDFSTNEHCCNWKIKKETSSETLLILASQLQSVSQELSELDQEMANQSSEHGYLQSKVCSSNIHVDDESIVSEISPPAYKRSIKPKSTKFSDQNAFLVKNNNETNDSENSENSEIEAYSTNQMSRKRMPMAIISDEDDDE